MTDAYHAFLESKAQLDGDSGVEPAWLPPFLFDFQAALAEWACRKGRAAILADCGLGKTPMQLVWAENVVRRTGGRVLILTPLAVAAQTIEEAEKFGIECRRADPRRRHAGIVVTNYEQLHHYDPADFVAAVGDESSVLKAFDGARRAVITEFLRTVRYRLLCTATPSPNDYVELGTSSEALGYLGHMDMLSRFFRNDQGSTSTRRAWGERAWRFKAHGEQPFWRWVCSWARAIRRPSDLGFADARFVLPALREVETVIAARTPRDGMLIDLPAVGMQEEREIRRRTLRERCEAAATKVADTGRPAVVWCHLNPEGDLLERLIPGAVQVSGRDSDEAKEEKFAAFRHGQARVLVIKPKIGAWGLNWEHCAHVTYFPSDSYEQYYQAVRRCWRFGQAREVVVDLITTEADTRVLANLRRKAAAADRMFVDLVAHMNAAMALARGRYYDEPLAVPAWL